MSDRCRARIIRVRRDKHGAVLAAPASIGDDVLLVKDAGDLAVDEETTGTLLADDDASTFLTFTDVDYVEDTDPGDLTSPDTVTLAEPLSVDLDAGTQLWVYEAPDDDSDDGIISDYFAICIVEDDEDDGSSGERLRATIPPEKQDELPVGTQSEPGVPVVLEFDDDTDEWTVLRFRGRARGMKAEADVAHTVNAGDIEAGVVVLALDATPINESLKLWWEGQFQTPDEYELDYEARTVTIELPTFVKAGHLIAVHYWYRIGQQTGRARSTLYSKGVDNPVSVPPGTRTGDSLILAITLSDDHAGATDLHGWAFAGESDVVSHLVGNSSISDPPFMLTYRLALYTATADSSSPAVPEFAANVKDTVWIMAAVPGGDGLADAEFDTSSDSATAATPTLAGANVHAWATLGIRQDISTVTADVRAEWNHDPQINIVIGVDDRDSSVASVQDSAGWMLAALIIEGLT